MLAMETSNHIFPRAARLLTLAAVWSTLAAAEDAKALLDATGVNLWTESGLPVSPFRTDTWQGESRQ